MKIRELPYVLTLEFSHNQCNTVRLIDELADWLEASDATLLSVSYRNNIDDDGYYESILVTVEVS